MTHANERRLGASSAIIRKGSLHTQRKARDEHTEDSSCKTQGEGGRLKTKERDFRRKQCRQYLELLASGSRGGRGGRECLFYQPPVSAILLWQP